jgi:hypothetical protein
MIMKSYLSHWLYSAMIVFSFLITETGFTASCSLGQHTDIWVAPRVITAGTPINIMAVSSTEAITELILIPPNGEKQLLNATANAGMPWRLSAQIGQLGEDSYRFDNWGHDNWGQRRMALT